MLLAFFQTLDDKQPTWTMESKGLIGSNPAMGFRPGPPDSNIESTLIWFRWETDLWQHQWGYFMLIPDNHWQVWDLSYNQYGTGKRIPIHSQCLSSPGLDYVMIVIQSQHRNTEQSLFLLGRPEWYWWCLFVSNYSWSIICVSLGMESTTGTGTTGLRGWRTLSRYKSCHRFENKNFPQVPLSSHSLNRQIGAVWTRFTYKLHLKVCNFISSLLKWKTTILGFSFSFLNPPSEVGGG